MRTVDLFTLVVEMLSRFCIEKYMDVCMYVW